MGDNNKDNSYDDISEMIENNAETKYYPSQQEFKQAFRGLASSRDEENKNNKWVKRYQSLQPYMLDIVRDGSDEYYKALTEAILDITDGDCGYIDYKGYKIYYDDTPHVKSISLIDGHKEYFYWVRFCCDALSMESYEEYHSEDERRAFIDPKNDLFGKTLALLDKEIELLDEGTWIKKKKTLNISDFKDYTPDYLRFEKINWDERNKQAAYTFSHLIEDARIRAKGIGFTEEDFNIFADVIRRMVFFADYGKRNSLVDLQRLIWFKWKPKTKRDRYIWRCMEEFGQRDLPDRLLDNCAIFFYIDDPQGWEAMAYLLPILTLWAMCDDYKPDNVKNGMLKVFDLVPDKGFKERIERLIEEDRAKPEKGRI